MAAKKIYFTQNKHESNVVKVFITDRKTGQGVIQCVPTENKHNADIIGFVVSNEREAQMKVFIGR